MTDKNKNGGGQPDIHYWRGFKELYQHADFDKAKGQEFPDDAKEGFDPEKNLTGISRRKFLALVGASAALAGTACSDYPDRGKIVPYNQQPEEIEPGHPNYYASTYNSGSVSYGILVKTREGRPIKIDGNPDDPVHKGKIDARTQAAVLDLYDPARLQEPTKDGDAIEWKAAGEAIYNALKNAGDKETAIVMHPTVSPTEKKLLLEFAERFPNVSVYTTKLFHSAAREAAWTACYGSGNFPLLKWDEADVILALESDFLGVEGDHTEQVMAYTSRRDSENTDNFNRLYVVEGAMSVTGMNADMRQRLRPDKQLRFVLGLINAIGIQHPEVELPAEIVDVVSSYNLPELLEEMGLKKEFVHNLVHDLIEHRGKVIVHAGSVLSMEVHVAVNLLNQLLGNEAMYRTDEILLEYQELTPQQEWKRLISAMKSGRVHTVIHYDANPVYHLPAALDYAESLKKVPVVVSLTQLENESSALANYVLPLNHPLESWGDTQHRTGYLTLQQPVIAPLYNTRQKESILLWLMAGGSFAFDETMYLGFLKERWETELFPQFTTEFDFERFWLGALHDGVVFVDDRIERSFIFNNDATGRLRNIGDVENGFAVLLLESSALGDGRYANNGWLQELPHPVTKVTWDNYASISYNTAKSIGVETGDLVEVSVDNRKVTLPVLVQPGMADEMIAVELGYGRTNSPVVAEGVGANANLLLGPDAVDSPFCYQMATLTKTGGSYPLNSSQEHYIFDDPLTKDAAAKRRIIHNVTVEQFKENPNYVKDAMHLDVMKYQIYDEHEYPNEKWAMSIDLNKCIGCGECVVACNAENNVPVVGKEQVGVSREMMWMRIDRYYSGDPVDPDVHTMPMLCQHCDQAPCENVCPVVATTHSNDGLNQMVYNRCVGTRYCSNNCPYKVRRFNFYDFRDQFHNSYQYEPSMELLHNPEVTVRSRGVMEKCTFCVQRIQEEKYQATAEGRDMNPASVKTACQQACPADAIVFGNENDKNSDVSKKQESGLGYYVLEEMNTKPNITYLAKLKNTTNSEES